MRYIVRTVSFSQQRLDNVEKLKAQIPNLEVYVDTQKDGYASFFAACAMIHETGGVLLEDDVQLCEGFCEKIEAIIAEKGAMVINFFEKPKVWFETSCVGGSNFMWTQCVYLPPHFPNKIKEYYPQFLVEKPKTAQGMAYDCLLSYTMVKEKMKYWRIRPCIVQHLDFKSVIGNRPQNRMTPFFIDDLITQNINYYDLRLTK